MGFFADSSRRKKTGRTTSTDRGFVDPNELMDKFSLEELNYYANEYYKLLPTPELQMGKPFSTTKEVAVHLFRLGLLFDCLQLSPSMSVLDFGAGTCWLSKLLYQMGCHVTALDVSAEALDIGKRSIDEYPVPTPRLGKISFLLFDGYKIDLPDNSCDRIVCYDVIHHVPNLDAVLKEFFRVLKPSGIVALSEPISDRHSMSTQSQHEMKTYKVLENNLDPGVLYKQIIGSGFNVPRFRLYPLLGAEISYESYVKVRTSSKIPHNFIDLAIRTSLNEGVFYFSKPGEEAKDSRKARGLAHEMRVDKQDIAGAVGESLHLRFSLKNVGEAYWIHDNESDVGVVKIGASYQEKDTDDPPTDFHRTFLPRDVHPGESLNVDVSFRMEKPGRYRLKFDLVSEVVTWFEHQGSLPVFVDVTIR